MAGKLHVGIVGYGIAGIAAAIHLRNQGHHIVHFDRNNIPVTSGAGMLLHPPAIRLLTRLGVPTSAMACGAPVRRVRAQTMEGRSIIDFSYGDLSPGLHGLGIQRSALHRMLSAMDVGKDQLRGGCEIVSVDANNGNLFDEDGNRHGPFDMIVVADGTNSIIREQLSMPVRHDRRSESAALVGLLNDVDGFAGDSLIQYFNGNRHLSVWPVGYNEPDRQQRCSIAINVLLKDAESFLECGGWSKFATRVCPALTRLIGDRVDNLSMHIFSYRDTELDSLAVGRVVLIGDAAHSMSPQLGNGAQLALEDAAILSDFIARRTETFSGLEGFSRSRLLQLRPYHRASRWITPLFQSESTLLARFRDSMLTNAMFFPGMKKFYILCLIERINSILPSKPSNNFFR